MFIFCLRRVMADSKAQILKKSNPLVNSGLHRAAIAVIAHVGEIIIDNKCGRDACHRWQGEFR